MNRFFKHNALYFFLAFTGAAMVPVMANAQVSPDNADGPQVVYYDSAGNPITSAPSAPRPVQNAAAQPANSGDAAAAPAAAGPADRQSLTIGGTMGGSNNNGYGVGVHGAYNDAQGRSVTATVTVNSTGNIANAEARGDGLWVGGTPAPVSAGMLANAHANVGSTGDAGVHAAVGGAARFKAGDACFISAGPAVGATYSTYVTGGPTTSGFGPGGIVGFTCENGRWHARLAIDAYYNAVQGSTSPVKGVASGIGEVGVRVAPNVDISAILKTEGELRDSKVGGNFSGFLNVSYAFDLGGGGTSSTR